MKFKIGDVVELYKPDSVNIDLDAEGKTLGIEIIDASKNLPANAIKSAIIIN